MFGWRGAAKILAAVNPSYGGAAIRTRSLLIYFLLALALGFCLLPWRYFIGPDGAYYARVGENIFRGWGIVLNAGEPYTDHPPLYPFLIGLANLFFKNLEFSGHFVSILAFALGVIPVVLIARTVYSEQAARWAGLLYSTHGFLLLHSLLVGTDSLFTLFVLTHLYLNLKIIRGEKGQIPLGAASGVLSGLAFLTRPEAILFYGTGSLGILLLGKRSYRAFFISLAVFLGFLVPQLSFIYKNTHRLQWSTIVAKNLIERQIDTAFPGGYLKGKKFREGLTEDKTDLRLNELVKNFNGVEIFTRDHFALLKTGLRTPFDRLLDLNKYLFLGVGAILVAVGFLGPPWNPGRSRMEFLFFLYLLTFAPKFFGLFTSRYFFPYLPVFLIWTGNGAAFLKDWVEERLGPENSKAGRTVGVILIVFFAVFSAAYLSDKIRHIPMPYEERDFGWWIKDQIPGIQEEYVASQSPAVSFYSGSKILRLPYAGSLEDLKTYLKHKKARYFVVNENDHSIYQEAYGFLLDETKPPPEGLIRRHATKAGKKIMLYEIADWAGRDSSG